MQISIFKEVPNMPRNKEEKQSFCRFVSSPYLPESVDCGDLETLINLVTNNSWSPNLFNGCRKQDNFVKTNFLVLDIDSDLTISDALERVQEQNLLCVCLPTSSHTKELNKYRLIFVSESTISDKETYKATMEKLVEIFPEADPKCVFDYARFYFHSQLSDDGFVTEGDLAKVYIATKKDKTLKKSRKIEVNDDIEPVVKEIYGVEKSEIPESVAYFIENAHTGLYGQWRNSLNSFVFSLAMQGISFETIYSIVEMLAPSELDSRDEKTIDNAFNDGYNVYESEKLEKEAI